MLKDVDAGDGVEGLMRWAEQNCFGGWEESFVLVLYWVVMRHHCGEEEGVQVALWGGGRVAILIWQEGHERKRQIIILK